MSTLSDLGLGTGRLASLGSPLTKGERNRLIQTALDHNIRVIDTADTYGSGDSERAIGSALKERRRDDAFLITKAGFPHVHWPAFLSPLNQLGKKFLQKVSPSKNFSRAYLVRSMERSLRRLGTDHVDAFLLHAVVSGETTSETWEALEAIRSKGMSRMTGISTSDLASAQEGLETGQVSIVESPVSVTSPSARQMGDLCLKFNVPLIANEALKPLSRLTGDLWDDLQVRFALDGIGKVDLLIAYAAAQPAVATVLVGTTSPSHLLDNQRGLRSQKPDPTLFAELERQLT